MTTIWTMTIRGEHVKGLSFRYNKEEKQIPFANIVDSKVKLLSWAVAHGANPNEVEFNAIECDEFDYNTYCAIVR